MKGENSYRKPVALTQLSGCKDCYLSRKERIDKSGNLHITKEVCKFGGDITISAGSSIRYGCSR